MSYTKIQKRKKRRKITSLIVMLLIGYLFLKPAINIISGGFKTTLPNKELLVDSIKAEGFFIRSEKVVEADVEGTLKKTAREGDRLAAGVEVVRINSLKDNSSLEREILEIDQAIEALEKSEVEIDTLENEQTNIEDLQRDKIEEIQSKIINKEYDTINISKEELNLYEKKQSDSNFSSILENETIENLKDRKDKITQQLSTNNIKYYTQNGGIVSYEVDGYEDIYMPVDLENYTYKRLDSDEYLRLSDSNDKKPEAEREVSAGQAIYKVIDDFEWYIAIKLDNIKEVSDLDVNQSIKIKIADDNSEVKGIIININKSNNTAVVVVKFNTMMYKFYNNRIDIVELIKSETDTLKIPKRSIIKKDRQDGVYIKNKGGIIEFKPVFQIKEIGEYVYIQTGDNSSNVYLKNRQESVRTITLFDEVILNTKTVKEGDIID